MARFIEITSNGGWGKAYVNLDQVAVLAVIPAIADPTKFAIGAYFKEQGSDVLDSGFETVQTGAPYATQADAEEALARLTQGYTLS